MIETILEEIRGLNLPLFWLTESEHGKRTTWSFVPDNPCNDICLLYTSPSPRD